MASGISKSRWVAFGVLLRVERDGEFATDLLHSPLAADLNEQDAGLAEELTLGVLRWRGELDWALAEATGQPPEKLDLEVRTALRLGLYQLRHLDRIPARAAVSQSVEIVKRARKASAAGLVNAALRNAAKTIAPAPPAGQWAVPKWMLERWRRSFGADRALKLVRTTLEKPSIYIRLSARFDAAETLAMLSGEGVQTAPTELPLCWKVRSGRPAQTETFRQGRIRIQDLGSQRIPPLLGISTGHTFLDVCAAPGGKTFQAIELREGEGLAVAADRAHSRLLVMRSLATGPVNLVALDATQPLPFSVRFDRILVDAPCSGTGTLARNPEIRWRLRPADIEDLAARQRAILARALEALAPGGRLVYSTCSLEPEENAKVVESLVDSRLQIVEQRIWIPGENEGDGFFACVIIRR